MIENNLIDRENAAPEEKGIYNFSVKGAGESEDIVSSLEQRKILEQIEATKSLLPIGSIISKGNNDEKYMIVGHFYGNYDYVLCKYPEGVKAGQNLIGIAKTDVVRIYNVGYIDNKDINNRKNLINSMSK